MKIHPDLMTLASRQDDVVGVWQLVDRGWTKDAVEADFCWPELRLIIEIDGPSYHRFKDEDARKTAIWRAAGYEVRRIPSGDVFDRPERLLALAPRPA